MSPDAVPMLTVRDLRVGYGGSTVLDGVSLDVGAGEAVAILGRNGAGKTTLIHTILGLLRPTGGRIAVAGRELTAAPTHVVARAGVAVVPQGRRVFAPLTVAEHLRICRPVSTSDKPQWTPERVVELLPRLGERWRHRGDQLSGGEQQMLAIARALLTNPRLLLLDEPSDGLAPAVVARVGDVIERLRAGGLTIVLVEQNLRLAFRLATRVAVLAKGRVAVDTPTADFRADGDRARRLLGV